MYCVDETDISISQAFISNRGQPELFSPNRFVQDRVFPAAFLMMHKSMMYGKGMLYYCSQKSADIGDAKADNDTDNGRQDKGNQSPFHALGFLFNGHTGGGTGPVHQ